MTLISLGLLYALAGGFLLYLAVGLVRRGEGRRRWGGALFWGILAAIYLIGDRVPPVAVGWAMCVLVVLAASGRVVAPAAGLPDLARRAAVAARLGNWIFVPALVIPCTAVVGTLVLARIPLGPVHWFDVRQPTLAALGFGSLVALAVGLRLTRAGLGVPMREGGRILHTLGWAVLLPQLLAALGGIFAQAGMGELVAGLVAGALPTDLVWVAVAVYCGGMALFTICLGNAFAAFPVIMLGIGLPIVVRQHGGDPAVVAAVGMLSGYCGTLLTPMAANFNLVPALLLELRDPHAVIRAQAPFAGVILLANIVILTVCVAWR